MQNPCVKKKGFTLIEILIVLGVIAAILALGLSSYSLVRKKIQLDLSAEEIQTIITESRTKTQAGYYDSSGDVAGSSYCFGFKLVNGGYVVPLSTAYKRNDAFEKCSTDENDITDLSIGKNPESIIIKEIDGFITPVSGETVIFFYPPEGEIQIDSYDENIRILIGYEDSDDYNDHREIYLNPLTFNSYTQKYAPEEE